jgi:membrane-associated phospholipid phosphatase
MIAIYGLELYLWKRYKEFKFAIFVIFIGFYIAYVLYLIFPAVGPRFYLHDFYSTSSELPGLYLTDIIRKMLDFGESIPGNVPNPVDFAQRDAMPSAHTSLALTIAYLSWKIKSKSFYFYLPYFFLMVFATIYLRYHYVVDIIAGTILAVLTIGIGEYLLKRSPEGKYGVIKKIQKMKNAPVKER